MENKTEAYDCTYVYSSEQQKEVKKILNEYLPLEQEDKTEMLRKLDRSVTKPGIIVSVVTGISGAVIHSIGLQYSIIGTDELFVVGVAVGIIGLILIALAYPLYRIIT